MWITNRLQTYWIDWPEWIGHLILYFPAWSSNKTKNKNKTKTKKQQQQQQKAKIKKGALLEPFWI